MNVTAVQNLASVTSIDGSPVPARTNDRPWIMTTGRHLRTITAQALEAIELANDPPEVFTFGNSLVRIRPGEDGARIQPFDIDLLRSYITTVADFMRDTKGGFSTPAHPKQDILKNILAADEFPVPPLKRLTHVPVVTPDGRVLIEPGYDAKSEMYYAPRDERLDKIVLSDPTPEDIAAAIRLIQEPFVDFPFDGPASRANMFGLLLTPFLQTFVGLCPLALIDAPQQGTGKTKLMGIISRISVGTPPKMMTAPTNDEEWRKKITATLLRHPSMINLDNIDAPIKSAQLASVLTNPSWEGRFLGESRNVIVPNNAVWVATGNNIKLAGDMQRRCYHIRMNAGSSKPWMNRTFKYPDLESWVEESYPQLVEAVLTVIVGWFAAGCPPPTISEKIGGFEKWSITVGGILEWAGIPGFLGNLKELYADGDLESAEWETWLTLVHGVYKDRPFKAAELAEAMRYDRELRGHMPDVDDRASSDQVPSSKTLGKVLAKHVDRRYGTQSIRIEKAGEDRGTKVWRVVSDPVVEAAPQPCKAA